MSDSGGSSGRLRDELGQLPYGDIRQCLVALASEERGGTLRNLFAHRFSESGGLEGHNVGNLMLAALTEITGGAERAIEAASNLLQIRGRVLPVTLTRTHLHAVLTDGTVLEREAALDTYGGNPDTGVDYVYLKPSAYSYPPAIEAIKNADLLVFSPGDLYTSLIPNLLVEDISEAILLSSAKVVLVSNIMTKPGETDGFRVSTIIKEVDRYLGSPGRINTVLVNSEPLPERLLQRYARERAYPLPLDREECAALVSDITERPLLAQGTYLQHDPTRLAEALMEVAAVDAGPQAIATGGVA